MYLDFIKAIWLNNYVVKSKSYKYIIPNILESKILALK